MHVSRTTPTNNMNRAKRPRALSLSKLSTIESFFQCRTKLLDTLLVVALADEDCTIVLGDDEALKSLDDEADVARRPYHAIPALDERHLGVTHDSVASKVLVKLSIERAPSAEVAPSEACRKDKHARYPSVAFLVVPSETFHDGVVN